jgi:hypothetical protein
MQELPRLEHGENAMLAKRAVAVAAIAAAISVPKVAQAQGDISISIARHAQLTADRGVIIRVHIACDPLPGTEDFQEALAGAVQAHSGAEAEGGLDGTVVCDGVQRTYTARLNSFTETVFKRGPASAGASLIVCNVVGDEQICQQAATQRSIVIRGRFAL